MFGATGDEEDASAVERNHARHYGRPEEPTSGSGRLLPNGLRTVS